MKIVKKIAKWFGILLVLLLAFVIAAPFIFKDKIIAMVKEETNKNLNAVVDFGEFDLTLISSFPDFTLSVNNVSVANIEPFKGDTLFSAGNFTATINLMSVLSGDQYKIRKIFLDKARIKASVLKGGMANWDIAKPSVDTTGVPVDTTAPAKFKLSLKSLEIKNAFIVYDDRDMNAHIELDDFNYTLSGDFTQDNFTLSNLLEIAKVSCSYEGIPYLNKTKTRFKADLEADMPNSKFTFKENELSLNELAFGMDGWFAMPEKGYDMDLKFNCNRTDFKSFLSLIPVVYSRDFANVKTTGNLAFNGFSKGLYTDNKLPSFGLTLKVDQASLQYPDLPKAVNNILIDLNIENKTGDVDATVTNLHKFHMEMAGNPLDVSMLIKTPVSDPDIKGEILGKIDLASVKDVLPLEKDEALNGKIESDISLNGRYSSIEKEKYEEFEAKGSLRVMDMEYKTTGMPDMALKTMTLKFSPKYVALENFDATMGKSDYKADGRIENFMEYAFKDSMLTGSLNLRSNKLDLNVFMGEEETTSTGTTAPDTSAMSIIEVPGNIDFVLNTSIGSLHYDTYDITDVKGTVAIKDHRINMKNLFMRLMGGSMIMNGTYSTVNPKVPEMDFDLGIKDFDIPTASKHLLTIQKLAPVAKYTTGRFSTDVSLKSRLNPDMMPDLNSLEGKGRLKTNQVVVTGFEPLNKLADALGGMDKFKKAEFSNLDISYSFSNGKVTYEKFPFKTGSIAGEVQGSTGFDQTIDYKMNMEVPTKDMPSGAKQAVTGLLSKANMLGVNATLPEKVKLNALFGGTVTNPTVKTDVKELTSGVVENVKDQVKEKIEEKVTEVKEDVKEKLNAEKEKSMKDAERTAQQIKDEAAKSAEKVRQEGYKQAEDLEKQAKNPIEKAAAKKAADKIRKETDEKANKIIEEGNKKAEGVMNDARAKADALK
jgi:uncharacterized protein involved in outer membrane biogenesis